MNPALDPGVAAPSGPAGAAAAGAAPVYRLLAEHLDGALGSTRRLRLPLLLLALIAAATLALLAWTACARIDRVVHTQGRIIPSGKGQLVQHFEGGIVSRVFVREGDEVRAGQELMAVSALQASSQRGEKQARLAGLQARAARLQAESDGAEHFSLPAGVGASAESQAEAAAFVARRSTLAQTLNVYDEQIRQKRQEMVELQTRQRGLNTELDTARQQQTLVSQMFARNAASQLEMLDARGRVERLVTQIREAEISLPRLQAAAQELQARRAEAVARFRSDSRTSLAETRVDLQRLVQELQADDDRVQRTLVTAPVAGRVNKLLVNTVGGVVKPGETLLELTPSDDVLVAEVRVAPQDRGPLREGQRAVLKVGAYDYTVFGTLEARIDEISADALSDERGELYFRMRLRVDPASLKAFEQAITPGMTVSADAITGNRTVLQFLLSPVRGLVATALRDRS